IRDRLPVCPGKLINHRTVDEQEPLRARLHEPKSTQLVAALAPVAHAIPSNCTRAESGAAATPASLPHSHDLLKVGMIHHRHVLGTRCRRGRLLEVSRWRTASKQSSRSVSRGLIISTTSTRSVKASSEVSVYLSIISTSTRCAAGVFSKTGS